MSPSSTLTRTAVIAAWAGVVLSAAFVVQAMLDARAVEGRLTFDALSSRGTSCHVSGDGTRECTTLIGAVYLTTLAIFAALAVVGAIGLSRRRAAYLRAASALAIAALVVILVQSAMVWARFPPLASDAVPRVVVSVALLGGIAYAYARVARDSRLAADAAGAN